MSGGSKVLVVGEDNSLTNALSASLRRVGYTVELARTDAEADHRAASEAFDLIVHAEAPGTRRAEALVEHLSPGGGVPRARRTSELRRLSSQLERQIDLLESVTRNTETCLAFLDRDFNFVWVNSAYANRSGHTAEELLGRNHFELFPSEENDAIFRRVRDTGEAYEAREKPFVYDGQPERGVTYWNWTLTPVEHFSGEIQGFDLSLVDVTEEVRDRLEKERLRAETSALLQGARAVLEHSEFPKAARAIFDSCKELLGATAGYVALLNADGSENELLFLDSGGLSCTVDPSLPMPIRGLRSEAYGHGRAVYENDFAHSQWVRYMPEGHAALENVLFAPLVIEGKTVGLLGLANKPGGFTDNDAGIASAFGELAALALSNSRALESLETSEGRFRAVAETANDAIISIDGSGRTTFWNHAAELIFGYQAKEMLGSKISVVMPERFRAAHSEGLRRVLTSNESRIIGQTIETVGLRRDGTEFPVELSLAAWRIGDEDYFTGIVRDISARKRAERELAAAREALELAYAREHRIADTLQRALIPEVRMGLPGYEVVAKYQPALQEAEVGGDFYDVFTLPDGRVALVMGDVSGKGLQAAVHTAMAKYMLRAFAHQNPAPGYVLARLNEAIYHYTPDDLFISIFYAVLDHQASTVTYGSAGHDGPLVYSPQADGVIPLDSTGCVAGIAPGLHYGEGVLKLAPGDVVLVYTDGITEARSHGRLFGLNGLIEVFAESARGDHREITDVVLAAAIRAGDGVLRDDAALLVLKATGMPLPAPAQRSGVPDPRSAVT